jgi:hypothetical protein
MVAVGTNSYSGRPSGKLSLAQKAFIVFLDTLSNQGWMGELILSIKFRGKNENEVKMRG